MFQNVYCNPSFARSFANLTYASSFTQELPDSVDLSLNTLDEEDLFASFDDDRLENILRLLKHSFTITMISSFVLLPAFYFYQNPFVFLIPVKTFFYHYIYQPFNNLF